MVTFSFRNFIDARFKKRVFAFSIAASMALFSPATVFADPGDINSVNNGHNISGGEYYNTQGSETRFENSAGTGLYVGAGTTVRGLEVNQNGDLTGNGGTLHFYAPNQVVRIDGTIDARAAMGPQGDYQGGGGTIKIEAGMLEQNGNLLTSGLNGGLISVNVGNLTMGPNAKMEANGVAGMPGNIDLRATGQINIPKGAVIDASGAYIGGYNPNVINIQGSIVNLDGIVMANGISNGNQAGDAGNIGIFGSEINIGSNANIQANGATADNMNRAAAGHGGRIAIGTDVQDYNQVFANNTSNAGNITANGGNGDSGMDAANGGIVSIGAKNNLTNDGYVSANGGQGFNGYNPSNGGEGGLVTLDGGTVANNGTLTANGGHGGTNSDVAYGPVHDNQQVSLGQDGGNGGNGGTVLVAYHNAISNPGKIEVVGGNGGNGQVALADIDGVHQIATGGNGGNAGNGGLVGFAGFTPSQSVLNNVNVSGGHGGQGGDATIKSDCGCATPGAKGACGAPGQIVITPPPTCTSGTCSPPPSTPRTPLLPLYPREYSNLGDTLPPNVANVLTYNKSIFLARSPMPIIQRKAPLPPPPPAPPVQIMVAKPKPKPPQKKVPVRGYW